jgi:hypothetical protein
LPAEAADLITAIEAAQDVRAQILAQTQPYDDLISNLTERLQTMLGDAEVGRLGGVNRVKWIRPLKFDTAAFISDVGMDFAEPFLKKPDANVTYLKKVRPDLYDRYASPTDSGRRFSIVDGT